MNSKCRLVAVAILGLLTSGTANAQLSINWIGPSGFSMPGGSTPVLDGGDGFAQLIYSADGIIAPATTAGPSGDNLVWDSGVLNEGAIGNPFAAGFSFQYEDPTFLSGSIFIRVFEGGANPLAADTWYYDGPLFAVLDNPDPAQIVDAGAAAAGSGDFGTFVLNQQVIPEPSVFAMLGLGGLFLMIRRRFINS